MSLPWELLYRSPVFLARQRRTPIVRHLETGSPADPPPIDRAVRVLGVVATPVGLPALDVEAEKERVGGATAKVVGIGRVVLDWLEPATPDRLREALRDNRYHIVHFVGHGGLGGDGAGVLYLEHSGDRRAIAVDGTALANLLASQDRLRLVVLNACHAARTTLTDPFAGVAATLIELGVPAVVAMQFEISDSAAIVFARELYTNLVGRHDSHRRRRRRGPQRDRGRGRRPRLGDPGAVRTGPERRVVPLPAATSDPATAATGARGA
jgi:hypothetical protein